MSKGVKLLAALMDDEVDSGHKLMGAARTLAGAVSELLRSVEPAAAEVRRRWHGFYSPFRPSSHKVLHNLEPRILVSFRNALMNGHSRSSYCYDFMNDNMLQCLMFLLAKLSNNYVNYTLTAQ